MVYINQRANESKLGIILAMMKLKEVRQEEFKINDIAFGAGLPDNEVVPQARGTMAKAARQKKDPYLKYDPASKLNEHQLTPGVAAYHRKKIGPEFYAHEVAITPGSTPVLDTMANITQYPGSTGLLVWPEYPLMASSIEQHGGTIDRSQRLVTSLDVNKDGVPYQCGGRWQIDYDSVRATLKKFRKTATLSYLNFPGNPTGYTPTKEEYCKLVEVYLEDLKERKAEELPAIAILDDMAYATMMHDDKKYYSLNEAIDDLRKQTTDKGRLALLNELDQSIVVTQTFSKSHGMAGTRVAYYASRNKELLTAVYNRITTFLLTLSKGTLSGMKGALEGDVNEDGMRQYGQRLRFLENGLNNITNNQAVPAKADAGFFAATFFDFMKGREVDAATIAELKNQISKMPNETLQKEFDGIFKDNKINNAADAALWLMMKANIVAIPIAPAGPDDKHLILRFAVGQTKIPVIKKALEKMEAAFRQLSPPVVSERTRAARA